MKVKKPLDNIICLSYIASKQAARGGKTKGEREMTRHEVLTKAGCTIREAEIIGLKLDALKSEAERVAWIERHLKRFLAAIRAMETLREVEEQERIANAAMADLEAMVRSQSHRVETDPYCEEVKALLNSVNACAWYRENMYGKRAPNEEWASREAIEAREAEMRKAALEDEAEAALAQAVQILGGAK
jgi:hypothetical protein